MIRISDRAVLMSDELALLSRELTPLATLQDVLRWGFAHSPRLEVVAVIVQDEYSHDVILAGADRLYLCFDTT